MFSVCLLYIVCNAVSHVQLVGCPSVWILFVVQSFPEWLSYILPLPFISLNTGVFLFDRLPCYQVVSLFLTVFLPGPLTLQMVALLIIELVFEKLLVDDVMHRYWSSLFDHLYLVRNSCMELNEHCWEFEKQAHKNWWGTFLKYIRFFQLALCICFQTHIKYGNILWLLRQKYIF